MYALIGAVGFLILEMEGLMKTLMAAIYAARIEPPL
ncbi:MAG: hypothetical protein QG572_1079, partial [Pseudomonadota bacterium]|nr:hypothetical protein [Pseudomonadota bacterium]